MAFVGHLDVVPTGPEEKWCSPPFAAVIVEGELIARGIADMKGSIACFLAALEQVNLDLTKGTLILMITCDEEGEAEYGTRLLVEHLKKQCALPDFCLIGEPTSVNNIGDTIKVGRRGSLSGVAKITGKAGHVAYPHLANNAAHAAASFAAELMNLTWDKISPTMSDTSLQITGLNTGLFTDNIIPAAAEVAFNVRYNLPYCQKSIVSSIENIIHQQEANIDLHWERPCIPYFTQR